MAQAYAGLFALPATGLRFFTVYGPWGRPDMAVYLFTRAIADGRPIDLFNGGHMSRDFTYIDDVTDGIVRLLDLPPAGPGAPHRLLNIGNDAPVEIGELVRLLERELGRAAIVTPREMQPGEAVSTWAEIDDFAALTGSRPAIPIAEGVRRFVAWYRAYHGA